MYILQTCRKEEKKVNFFIVTLNKIPPVEYIKRKKMHSANTPLKWSIAATENQLLSLYKLQLVEYIQSCVLSFTVHVWDCKLAMIQPERHKKTYWRKNLSFDHPDCY